MPALPAWTPQVAAQILGILLGQTVSAEQVVERAVGLGLLRYPASDPPPHLSPQILARLCLAGYRLPAHVERGTLTSLREHVEAGRQVFVLLRAPGCEPRPQHDELLQVQATSGNLGFLLAPLGQASGAVHLLASEAFARAWQAAGNLLVAALRGWAELPVEGRAFFAGTQDPDSTYHWDTAECVTDSAGRILRC
jgi:hypothetical protein